MYFSTFYACLLFVSALTGITSSQATSTYSCGPMPGFNASNSQLDAYMSHGCDQETSEQYQARLNRTVWHPIEIDEEETCVLWDASCKGDKNKALGVFFGTTDGGILASLLGDPCFTTGGPGRNSCTGTTTIPPASSAIYSTVKSWMRTGTDCLSNSVLAHHMAYGNEDDPMSSGQLPLTRGSCCGICGVNGANVDVYYWPVSNANTDCLSIVGTATLPPLSGASVVEGTTCWGNSATPCTAVYTSVGGLTWKSSLFNPWYTSPTGPPLVKRDAEITASPLQNPKAPLQARAHPIALPHLRRAYANGSVEDMPSNRSMSGNDTAHGSTLVFQGHTFTSPSIYVNFYQLTATDECGYVGSQKAIPSTMLAFAPGELSTVDSPNQPSGAPGAEGTSYNFADLPCPPMSKMVEAEWKPEAGNPYRPIIAFPSKLRNVDPAWSNCGAGLFGGWDPPRTLEIASAMAPDPTPASEKSDPNAGVAAPASTHDPLPQNTKGPQMVPPPTQSAGIGDHIMFGFGQGPSKTEAAPKSQSTDNDPQQGTTASKPTPQDSASDPNDGAEKQDQSPVNTGDTQDPSANDSSDEKMSALRQALAPAHTADGNPASAGTSPENAGSNQSDSPNNSGDNNDPAGSTGSSQNISPDVADNNKKNKPNEQKSNSDHAAAPEPQTPEEANPPTSGSDKSQSNGNSASSPQHKSDGQADPGNTGGPGQQQNSASTDPNISTGNVPTEAGPSENTPNNDNKDNKSKDNQPSGGSAGGNNGATPNENVSNNDETAGPADKNQPSGSSASGKNVAVPNDNSPDDTENDQSSNGNNPSGHSTSNDKPTDNTGPSNNGQGNSAAGNENDGDRSGQSKSGNKSSGNSDSNDKTKENAEPNNNSPEGSPVGNQNGSGGSEQSGTDNGPTGGSASNDKATENNEPNENNPENSPVKSQDGAEQHGAEQHDDVPDSATHSNSDTHTDSSPDQPNDDAGEAQTYHLPSFVPTTPAPSEPATIAGHIIHPQSSGAIVDGETVNYGALPSTISGTAVSIDSSHNNIYIGSNSYSIPSPPTPVSAADNVAISLPNGATAVALPKSGGVSIYGTTLQPGAQATVSGKVISLDTSSNLIYGTQGRAEDAYGPVTTVASQAVTPVANGVLIGGSKVENGAPAITVGGQKVSYGHSTLVLGANTVPLAMASLPTNPEQGPVTTVANHAVTPIPNGAIIDGATVSDGASATTISGTPVSFAHSTLVVGSSAVALSLPSPKSGPVTTVANKAVTPIINGAIIDGKTVSDGASATTISGTPVYLSHSTLAIGSSSVPLVLPSSDSKYGSVTTVGDKVVTPLANGAIVDGATISNDASATTISGTRIIMSHSTLAIGSTSATLALPSAQHGSVTTVANKAVTPLSQGVEVAGTTLTDNGPAQTISGTVMSFGHSKLVVGSSSVSLDLPMSSMTTSDGGSKTGSATTSGSGNSNGGSTPTAKGGAARARRRVGVPAMGVCVLGALFLLEVFG